MSTAGLLPRLAAAQSSDVDTVPASMVGSNAFALAVGPSTPDTVHTLKDNVAWAGGNPTNAAFGSPAAAATPHFVGMMLAKASGVALTHVPRRGDAPGIPDLLGGYVLAFVSTLGSFIPHIRCHGLRLLVLSGTSRKAGVPDVPTCPEQGNPIDNIERRGIFFRMGTPPEAVQRIGSAVQAEVTLPDFVKLLADVGLTPQASTPSSLAQRVHDENEPWRVDIKMLGFTGQS